jgi:Na+/H+-dicarboxylate symporter
MNFNDFTNIIMGMTIIGFSIGYIVGFYVSDMIYINYLEYISAPLLGLGSMIVIYTVLFKHKKNN